MQQLLIWLKIFNKKFILLSLLFMGHFLPSPTTYEETGLSGRNHYEGSGHVPFI